MAAFILSRHLSAKRSPAFRKIDVLSSRGVFDQVLQVSSEFLIALLTVPILLVATAWFKRNIKASFQAVRDKVSAINSFVQEHIVGMNIVQIFNREEAAWLF